MVNQQAFTGIGVLYTNSAIKSTFKLRKLSLAVTQQTYQTTLCVCICVYECVRVRVRVRVSCVCVCVCVSCVSCVCVCCVLCVCVWSRVCACVCV